MKNQNNYGCNNRNDLSVPTVVLWIIVMSFLRVSFKLCVSLKSVQPKLKGYEIQ